MDGQKPGGARVIYTAKLAAMGRQREAEAGQGRACIIFI